MSEITRTRTSGMCGAPSHNQDSPPGQPLLRSVITNELKRSRSKGLIFLRRITVLGNHRNRNEVWKQSRPRFCSRYHQRACVRSFHALDKTLSFCAGAFVEAGRLRERTRENEIERVFRIGRGERSAIVKLHTIAQNKRERDVIPELA